MSRRRGTDASRGGADGIVYVRRGDISSYNYKSERRGHNKAGPLMVSLIESCSDARTVREMRRNVLSDERVSSSVVRSLAFPLGDTGARDSW